MCCFCVCDVYMYMCVYVCMCMYSCMYVYLYNCIEKCLVRYTKVIYNDYLYGETLRRPRASTFYSIPFCTIL